MPQLRWWTRVVLPVGLGFAAAAALLPIDAAVTKAIAGIGLGGDLRRELEALQQFGQGASILIGCVAIGLVQPWRFRRVLDWLLAAAIASVLVNGLKTLFGRVRPGYTDDPLAFFGPIGVFERETASGVVPLRAIDLASELQSMPSSHTSHAVIAAVFISAIEPRLRWLVVPWAGLVALARIVFGAHWASDVVLGAALGWAVATVVVTRRWGVRLVDTLWRTLIDRRAEPALPGLLERERNHPGA